MTDKEVKALEEDDKILFDDGTEKVTGVVIALEGCEGPLVKWSDQTSCHIHLGNQKFCHKMLDNPKEM